MCEVVVDVVSTVLEARFCREISDKDPSCSLQLREGRDGMNLRLSVGSGFRCSRVMTIGSLGGVACRYFQIPLFSISTFPQVVRVDSKWFDGTISVIKSVDSMRNEMQGKGFESSYVWQGMR